MSKIVSIATAVPAHKHAQEAICGFADKIYSSDAVESRKLKFLYRHSGIETRYSVIPDYSTSANLREFYSPEENLEPFPDLEKRMSWYEKNAAALSVSAIEKCITGKIKKENITHLITVSCTGMSAPGLDLEVMELMGLDRNIFRTSVNFMGCYAAIHGLKLAHSLCHSDPNANIIVVCTEFCTLHFQKEPSADNITSTLLFADGCAAVLVQSDQNSLPGIKVHNFYSDVAFNGKRDMSWKLSSKGFLMTLSGYVPELVQEDFDGLVSRGLERNKFHKDEITHWCIHPGGKKILEAIEKSTGIEKEKLHHSYEVLKNYGNMSSPTILFVLQRIFNELLSGENKTQAKIFAAAFGPGLTMETFTATYD